MKLAAKQILVKSFPAMSLLAVLVNSAAAQAEDDSNIENVLVSGARIQGANVAQSTVISEEQIRRRNSASAVDLLRNNVGIDLIQPGGPGGVTELFIRGAESNFTVISIDGVRVNDTTNSRGGGFDLSSLNPDTIMRVEIMRGPLSSALGSDALAGAVNIVTRNAATSAPVFARAEGGSEGYRRAYIGVAAGEDTGLSATATAALLDAGEPVEGSTSETQSFNAQVDYVSENGNRLDTSVRITERDRTSYPAASGGPRLAASDALETAEAEDTSLAVRWRQSAGEKLNLDFQLSHFERDESLDSPAVDGGVLGSPIPAMVGESNLTRDRLTAFARYDVNEAFKLAVGVDLEQESGENDSIIDLGFPLPSGFDLSRDTQAAFAELNYENANGIDLFVSTRFDSVEDADSETSSKLALAYSPADSTRVGVSWGEAFKMPSFYALGDSLVGNPDLEPETSETKEVFLEQFLNDGKLRISVAAFASDYENLIDFDFATFKMVNRDSISIEGVELESVTRIGAGLEIGAHITYTDYDVGSGEELDGRPNWRGGLYSEWHNADWSARAHAYYAGERPSSSTATGQVELDSYNKLDFVVVRRLNASIDLSFNIDNAFDTEYEDEIGFPSPGRMFRLGIAAKL